MKTKQEKTIGVREFSRNLPRVARATKKGVSFVVTKNATPIFRIEPVQVKRNGKHNLDDLLSIRFNGEKNLSNQVDEIVYQS